MFCNNCGESISDEALFCHRCGLPVVHQAPAAEPVVAQVEPVAAAPVEAFDPFATEHVDKTVCLFDAPISQQVQNQPVVDPFAPHTAEPQQAVFAAVSVAAEPAGWNYTPAPVQESPVQAMHMAVAQPVAPDVPAYAPHPVSVSAPVPVPAPVVPHQPVKQPTQPLPQTKHQHNNGKPKSKVGIIVGAVVAVAVIAVAALFATGVIPLPGGGNGTYVVTERVVNPGTKNASTTTYTYDAEGKRLTTTHSEGDTYTDGYDANGNLKERKRDTGTTTFSNKVENGRVIQEIATSPKGSSVVWKYTYDADGNRVTKVTQNLDKDGKETGWKEDTYDAKGRIIQKHVKAVGNTKGSVTIYTYTEENGKVTGFTVDVKGSSEPAKNYTCKTDDAGNIIEVSLKGTVVRSYTYQKIDNPGQYCKDMFTQFEF